MSEETEDRRAADQDAAVEAAFVAAVLPEEDRRHEEADEGGIFSATKVPDGGYEVRLIEDEVPPPIPSDAEILASAGLGSVFEKVAHGWKVRYVDGGAVIFCEGPTLGDAVASHGQQVTRS